LVFISSVHLSFLIISGVLGSVSLVFFFFLIILALVAITEGFNTTVFLWSIPPKHVSQ